MAERVGERVHARAPSGWGTLASAPLLLAAPSGGCSAVFRYGVLVHFGVSAADRAALAGNLTIRGVLLEVEREREELTLQQSPESEATIEGDTVRVPDLRPARLQLVAEALAKSVALDHHEKAMAASFDAVEPLARRLHLSRLPRAAPRMLLSLIGDALLAEHQMTGRVEVRDKPDLLWSEPTLERFYLRLEDELELRERATQLERKLELASRTARTALELLQNRRTLRVEWYIVALIVVEIALSLLELWRH